MIALGTTTIELPLVGESAIEKWKNFLRNDAVTNGGSASVLLRRIVDNAPLKITAFNDGIIVIEVLDGFNLAKELAMLEIELEEIGHGRV